jgi:hypothetical protein
MTADRDDARWTELGRRLDQFAADAELIGMGVVITWDRPYGCVYVTILGPDQLDPGPPIRLLGHRE